MSENELGKESGPDDAAKQAGTKAFNSLVGIGCLLPIACVVLIVLLFIGGSIWTSIKGPSEEQMAEKFGTACYNEVRAQLKDPASADITDTGVTMVDDDSDDPRFQLSGTGRAGNSFGGMATFSFECTGTYSKSAKKAYASATVSSN